MSLKLPRRRALRLASVGVLASGLLASGAAAASASTSASTSAATSAAHPAGSVSSGDLTCNYGVTGGGFTGWGECIGSGHWQLNVGCNLNPTVLTDGVTQYGGKVYESNWCWQGVNNVWITF